MVAMEGCPSVHHWPRKVRILRSRSKADCVLRQVTNVSGALTPSVHGVNSSFTHGIQTAKVVMFSLIAEHFGSPLAHGCSTSRLSRPVSSVRFGNEQHAAAVALLSIAVFFRLVSDGQGALIQGMRRIADLAKMGVLGAVYGTLISIGIVYFLGNDGVAPSLVGVAAMGLITSWWYSRKVHTQTPAMTASQMGQESAALLKLGFAFMASGLMMMGAAYVVRIIVVRQVGFDAAGLYQAAWALGGLYVGFILQAMATDFYPRLTAVGSDNTACNRIVNEQAQVSLLLAGPGVIATLTFAPLIIGLFYTPQFHAAVDVLRWLCLGMALRIISWPMGFIILSKGAQNFFFWSELAWTAVYLGLAWICVSSFG